MGLATRRDAAGRRDGGDIVLGWLVKITLTLAVVAVCLFDAISVAVAHVRATDDATEAATAASEIWQRSGSRDLQGAYEAAFRLAGGRDEQVPTTSFRIDPDGTVHLRLLARAPTLLIHRVPPIARLGHVAVVGSGRAVLS